METLPWVSEAIHRGDAEDQKTAEQIAARAIRYELYKVSLKYDNPAAHLTHSFPPDMQSKEVKEMMKSTENTGPYAMSLPVTTTIAA